LSKCIYLANYNLTGYCNTLSTKGNSGTDDELIQHQIVKADEGIVVAMLATGDLYYYGARGLPRDQIRALHYYSLGAAVHDPLALCGAAAMHLKVVFVWRRI
jgi:SEL1 protein